jgi:hypothetical protein
LAALLWGIWCTRNEVCFDKKRVKSPTFLDILGRSTQGGLEGASDPRSGCGEDDCAPLPQARSEVMPAGGASASAVCWLMSLSVGACCVFCAARPSTVCNTFTLR